MTETKEQVKVEPKFKRLPITDDGELIDLGNIRIKSPRNLVIVKYPKSGSTLSICNVDKFLIMDTENGTEDFSVNNKVNLLDKSVEGKFELTRNGKYGYIPKALFDVVTELYHANNMAEYWKLKNLFDMERNLTTKQTMYEEIVTLINKMPFPILCVDTITSILELSNQAALYEYNLTVKPESRKLDIKRIDDWGGTYKIRNKFAEIKKFIEQNAAPFIQYFGHIATKKKVLKKDNEDVNALDIALEGLLSVIFTSQADSVATFYRNSEGCYLDFMKKDMETDLGSRPMHLANKIIKIADIKKDEDEFPITHWGTIYPEIKKLQKDGTN